MPFRYFVFSPGIMARRNDEKTPRRKLITKKRHVKKRKDEITPGEKTKCRKDTRRNKSFKWRYFARRFFFFVISRGGFRYFVFSPGVISSFRFSPGVCRAMTPGEKTK